MPLFSFNTFNTFFSFFLSKFIIIVFSVVLLTCTGPGIRSNERLCFAVIGNTAAESPYSGQGPMLAPVIKSINAYNPVFLIHLGGMVCAGSEWQGIAKLDVDRQYREFRVLTSGILPIFYPVLGDSELFNNSSEYYSRYMSRGDYYSFNYGNLHFIVINSTGNAGISEKQRNWIKEDIRYAENSEAIFIFTHNPFFVPGRNRSKPEIRHGDYEDLHKYFVKYPVKAVFSGRPALFFKLVQDGITYINTGCGGFNKNELFNSYNQFYIINYKNGTFAIQPGTVNNGSSVKAYSR